MLKLFHATSSEQPLKQTLRAPALDPAKFDDFRRSAEELLEQLRPFEKPSRLNSWFMCEKPAHAATYLRAEADRPIKLLYEVEVPSCSRHPMYLVNAIAKHSAKGDAEMAERLAAEYWGPTQAWRFWECLSPELTAVEQQDWPDPIKIAAASLTYSGEANILSALLSRPAVG